MCVVERGGDAAGDPHRAVDRERPVLVEQAAQVGAVDQLHDEVGDAVVLTGVVRGDDVGVGEAGDGDGLVAKARPQRLVDGELGVQRLDRDAPREQRVLADPHAGHAAAREQGIEAVATVEDTARSSRG